MSRSLCGALLLFASIAFAQQQGRPPVQPPYSTPPTFPEGQQNKPSMPPDVPAPAQRPGEPSTSQRPSETMPSEIRNPNSEAPASRQVMREIQQQFDREPLLKDSSLKVVVDNATITLTGTVDNEEQHRMALRIVAPYRDERNIDDQIKVRI